MSDERCGAECRDGTPCQSYPVGDSDRCRMHGGTNDGAPAGNDNAWKHGAFSDLLRDDLTEPEKDAHEQLTDKLIALNQDHPGIDVVAPVAAEALIKYKRSADDRFLREWRQHISEFNVVPNEDEINMSGELSWTETLKEVQDGDS